ncbi:helix-turn-helix transcriptional regulator [Methanosarcina mazei]|uniref:ArsR family transcriptional regulator n=1 Tax=Methanosarcina mazei TaxID=2209 RepID=A0A0F8GEP5_METMZ|nr:winged helix-turn-helix domain-containing protein [Methanosarcina mazei]KKG30705.1 ArsR family transcriptional regulator [Methanosarcina mazei]
MKSTGLLSILTFSEKRKNILFLLQENPKTLSEIKDYFDVRSPEILPRLKEMENSNMIVRQEGVYKLTSLGKVAAIYYKPFLDTLTAIETNEDFWRDHDITAVSDTLLSRIQELKECRIIKDEHEHIYDSHKAFMDNVPASNRFMGFASIFLPSYPARFLEMARRNIPISIIVTPNVFFKIKNEHNAEIEEYLKFKHTSFHVYDTAKVAFVVTDRFLSLSLFFKNGTFDPRSDLVGFDSSSIKWGEDLFKYYKENAVEIKTL